MTMLNFMKLIVTVAMVAVTVYASYLLCDNPYMAFWATVCLIIGFSLCAMWKLR
ncbi:hypothetical protein DEU42_113161 [Flavobacterium sp. AG291]|nr:hypothetical protein DEU42_113161 [Flavobacterium sp. AG291]